MGQLKSAFNWTGREINGCILGEPTVDKDTGEFIWDGAVPTGEINVDGDILQEDKDKVVKKLQPVGEFKGLPSKTRPAELTKAEVLDGKVKGDFEIVKEISVGDKNDVLRSR